MKKKIKLNYNGKKFEIDLRTCNWFDMFRGLMFRRREKASALLLFNFKKPVRMKIHSLFVFFPFIAVWLDDKDRIIEIKKIIPWRLIIFPKKSFYKLIEIPINKKYKKLWNFSATNSNKYHKN